MMTLDSTINKILSNSREEPSANSENRDVPTQIVHNSKPEAEVRLVVRFTVEEQLVYNGNIERVNLLESEELSRIVSRVAWDGATSSKDTNSKCEKNDPLKSDESSKSTSYQTKCPDTSESQPSSEEKSEVKKRNQAPENDCVEITESSKISASKSGPEVSVALQENDKILKDTQDWKPAGQSNVTTDCDTLSKLLFDDYDKTKRLHIENPSQLLTIDKREYTDRYVTDSVNLSTSTHPYSESSPRSAYEAITKTLNDCINNIDSCDPELNTEREKPFGEREKCVLNDTSDSPQSNATIESDTHEEKNLSSTTYSLKLPKTHKLDSTPTHQATALTRKQESGEESETLIKASANSDLSMSIKRRASPKDLPSGKRMRRGTSKEKKSLLPRTPALRTTESSGTRRASQSRGSSNFNSGRVDNPPRHHMIFAKWTDNHFYPGNILRPSRGRKFVVNFYDGAQRDVSETDMIPLSNITGKQVRVTIADEVCFNAIVHSQNPPTDPEPMFDVEYHHDGLVRRTVPLRDLFLTPEQGTPLITGPERNSGASNFADVDLDNIIYEKRSRRFQDLEEFDVLENSPSNAPKKRRNPNGARSSSSRAKSNSISSNVTINQESENDLIYPSHEKDLCRDAPDHDMTSEKTIESPELLKSNSLSPSSNPTSGSPSVASSSNPANNGLDPGQGFYFTSSSPSPHKNIVSFVSLE